jgi:hypothetical protein
MARRYPPITEADILRLREHCLEREAKGNKPGGSFTDNVDLRRGIIFYHSSGGEWYLYRDWRDTWNKKYPQHPVDPQSTLKPRKAYRSRRELDSAVHHLQNYDRSVCWLALNKGKWQLIRTTHEDGYSPQRWGKLEEPLRYISDEWDNSIDAYEAINGLYQLFNSSCPLCGCWWPENKRYRDSGDRWHCGCCHATPDNTEISGLEPALRQPIQPGGIEPQLGGKS